ncbi:MAG TPA: proton-conducting transporter membrane subunit [Acidobacteriaceae bacterium]|nr:proton-conducting transporter membrane subunit [Acidobacteriaceae bacterium]
MIRDLLILLFGAPLAAIVLSFALRRPRLSEYATVIAAVIDLGVSIPLLAHVVRGPVVLAHSYLQVDALGGWVILCVSIVYTFASIYAVGYMRLLNEEERLPLFYGLFSGFAFTMLAACIVNNVGVFWIAIELTTLVSTFLVGFEREAESTEAAWKYIVVVSGGISLALLGTVLFYWGGSLVLGPSYAMTWAALHQSAPSVYPPLLLVSFLLVLVGYGTKAGLAPMHTWLPDAHSESPAPVSAMLSGALLNASMLGIARFLGVVNGTTISRFAHSAVVGFGIFSFVIATLFIVRQTGIKRLMAYSSVEHIGVQALGLGFGGALGVAGALYHMLNHSLNKSLMFFGAGNAMRAYGTKEISGIRHVLKTFPVSGTLWLLGALGIAGAPPFALFQSEFTILRAGIGGRYRWAVIVFGVFLVIVFIAFLSHFRAMYFDEDPRRGSTRISGTLWRTVPMWLAFLPLLVLGLWWPHALWDLFTEISKQVLGGMP